MLFGDNKQKVEESLKEIATRTKEYETVKVHWVRINGKYLDIKRCFTFTEKIALQYFEIMSKLK